MLLKGLRSELNPKRRRDRAGGQAACTARGVHYGTSLYHPLAMGHIREQDRPDPYNPKALRISTARMSCSLEVTRLQRRVRVGMLGQVLQCCVGWEWQPPREGALNMAGSQEMRG